MPSGSTVSVEENMKRGRSIILPSTDAQGLPGVYSYTRSQENHLREDYRYCTTVATVLVPGSQYW